MLRSSAARFRNLFARRIRPIRNASPLIRPRLEDLELRTVPATTNWIATNGTWGTAANWSNGVPGPGDIAVIKPGSASTISVSGTASAAAVQTNSNVTLSISAPLTIGATTVGSSEFGGTVNVNNGGTLEVDSKASIQIDNGIVLTVNAGGAFNLNSPAAFTIDDHGTFTGDSEGIIVNGAMNVNSANLSYLSSAGASTNDSTSYLQVKPNGQLSASNSKFGWDVLSIDTGSILSNNTQIQNNIFNTTLYVSPEDVPLLSQNTSFQDINLNSSSNLNSGVLDLGPMGSNPAQRYIIYGATGFTGSAAPFEIPQNATIEFDTGSTVLINNGVFMKVDRGAALDLNSPKSFTIDDHGTFTGDTEGIIVNGLMTVNQTNISYAQAASNTNDSISYIQILSGGHITAMNSTFGWDDVALDLGSTQAANDFQQDAFNTTLYVPVSDVPILAAGNNTSFQDVNLLSSTASISTFGNLKSVDLAPLGATSAAQEFVFPGLVGFNENSAAFTIPTNTTLNVRQNSTVLMDLGVSLVVNGAFNITNPSAFKIVDQDTFTGGSEGIEVASGGDFISTNGIFGYSDGNLNDDKNDFTSFLKVDNGGTFDFVGGFFGWDKLILNSLSNDTMQFAFVESQIDPTLGAKLALTSNDFSVATVASAGGLATGPHINLTGNYWGTTNDPTIEKRITDGRTNNSLPIVDFDPPILTARPAEPLGASATANYNGSQQQVNLTATVVTPTDAGNVLIKEGQVTFTVVDSANNTIGQAQTVSIDSTTGIASVLYSIPTGTLGGSYTIIVVYNDTGSTFESNTIDSSHTLTIAPVISTTTAVDSSVTITGGSQSVLLMANLGSLAGTVIDGSVTFTILQGTTVIVTSGAATVVNGVAQISVAIPAGTEGGLYSIQANYSGSESFLLSDNTASLGTLTLNEAASFTSDASTTFVEGMSSSFQLTASGFPAPTFTLDAGSNPLPAGVTLSSSGLLSGIPTVDNVFTFTVDASNGIGGVATQTFTLTINSAPSFTSAASAEFEVGTVGNFTAIATGFPDPTFSASGLPNGLIMSSGGTISGDPTQSGAFNVTITATNTVQSVNQNFTLTVNAVPIITSSNNASFTQGVGGTFTFSATGFPTPTLSLTGSIPAGVSFDPATGILTVSNAAANGVTTLTFSASNTIDSVVQTISESFTLTIGSGASITSAKTTTFALGDSSSTFTVTAAGFPTPTFSEVGALPGGIALDPTTGVLSGTPTQSGSFAITLIATNSLAAGQQSFTLIVTAPPQITSASSATFFTSALNSFTVTASGFPAPTFTATGLPADISLNATTGILSGTPGPADVGGFPVTIIASNGIGTPSSQSFVLTIQTGAAPQITSANSTTFSESSLSSFSVVATGNPAATFTETGTLPTGVSLASNGTLSGTPTQSGSFPITITATNLLGTNQQSFALTVTAPPTITSADSTTIVLGQAVNFQVAATGFPVPTFTMTGSLPTGVTLSPTGLLSGTAAVSGSFTITITATNSIGSTQQTFIFTVNQAATITSASSTRFALDTADSFQFAATGFPAPTFSTTTALPPGLSLSASGLLSGEPTSGGSFTIVILASNGIGPANSQNFTLTIVPPVVFAPLELPDGQVAAAYNQPLSASGPAGPFTFRVASGSLPAGLSLSANGVVSGSPTQAGSFTITASATDSFSDTGTQVYTFTIVPAPVPLSVSGAPDGSAVQFVPSNTGSYTLGSVVDPFQNTGASSRTAVADVNGDGVPDTIFVTGPGTPIRVAVVNGATGSLLVLPFDPFGGNFTGGGFVAAGDFDGDGRAEFVITPDQGGGPRVSIFSLSGFDPKLRANFFTVDPTFRGGARPAVGDINGDGVPDLAVAAGFGGGPRVSVINGKDVFTTDGFNFSDRLVGDFFAFGDDLRNGVYLAIGDVNGDGFGDLIFGAGPGGGPEVLTISGQTLITRGALVALASPISNFFVDGSDSDRSGVRVTTTDADRDGLADVVVATGADVPSGVRVYLGKNFGGVEPTRFQDLDPFQSAVLADGVYVG